MRTKHQGDSFANTTIHDTPDLSTPKKKLIDRVTKLFALADSTLHEGEATSARNMAVELLAKHNLSLNQKEVDEQEHITITNNTGKRVFEYDKILHLGLTEFTEVFMFLSSSKKKTTTFHYIGTPVNLRAFQYMLSIVLQQRASAYIDWTTSANCDSDNFAWKNGFSIGVTKKCRELTDQMITKVEEKGLVVVSELKSAKNYAHESHNLKAGSKGSRRSNAAGIEAGRAVNFNKGVTAQKKVLQIGN